MSGDLEAARALIAEAEAHDGVSPVSDQALLAAARGQRELFAPPGAVGILGQGEVDLVVRPEDRGRGLGTALLTQMLESADDGAGEELRAWSHGENPAAEALLERAGFRPIRTLYRMALDPALLPSDGRDPLALPVPDGYALRAFDPERPADAAAWVRANAAAFAHHPEQGRITEADFALMREEPWFDAADLILLAEDGPGSEIAGSTWIKTVPAKGGSTGAGAHDGKPNDGAAVETELYAVGVRPEHAGRGLGGVLLDATLARMAQHRPTRVTLYVDGDNEAALKLYARVGFTVDQRSTQWARSGA